jgi:2-polyprenyl-3-methyl-5-hydroxy-6-metoxy-1,4-benzoquinol methylase
MPMTGDAEYSSVVPIDVAAQSIVPGSAYHEGLAAKWTKRYESGAFARRRAFILGEMAGLQFPGTRWVDAGCGSGVFSRELGLRGAEVIGVDASPAMITAARASATPAGSCVTYQLVESIDAIPLDDGAVHGVVCLSVLEYVESPRRTICELARVIEPGGWLIITVPNLYSAIRVAQHTSRAVASVIGWDVWRYLAVSRHSFSRLQCLTELKTAGLDVIRISSFSAYWQGLLSPIGAGGLWVVLARKRVR